MIFFCGNLGTLRNCNFDRIKIVWILIVAIHCVFKINFSCSLLSKQLYLEHSKNDQITIYSCLKSYDGRFFIPPLCLKLRGGTNPEDDGIQRINLDDDINKPRRPLFPWQKRRRRPRPRDHRISPVNQPFARVLPTDRRQQPTYEDRRRRSLGSFADAHARSVAALPAIANAEAELSVLLDEDR
jgi:hypothetical protein